MTPQERIEALEHRVRLLVWQKAAAEDEAAQAETLLKIWTEEEQKLERVEEVLQQISAKVLGQSVDTIDKLVTTGLKVVFDDQNLTFSTQIKKYRGKTSVTFHLAQDGNEAPLLTAYGGGVLALVGILLRVTTIIILGQRRFLVIDESLSHVHAQYIENTSRLLKKLGSELGFDILMVTHQPQFTTYAERHYEARQEGGTTTFQERKL